MSIIWATSLSPRPDRFISTVLPCNVVGLAHDPGQRVRALERGDDALGAGQQLERLDDLGVGDGRVLGPADRRQVRVLGSDARVVETGGDRLGLLHLAVLVLHQVAAHAVHDPGHATPDRRSPGGLDADQPTFGRRRSR